MNQQKPTVETSQPKPKNPRLPYIAIIIGSSVVVAVLIIVFCLLFSRHKALVAQQKAIEEQYALIATMHNNLTDEDYAAVYFDGNDIHFDNNNLIIEYQG